MMETTRFFGAHKHLVGTFTEPEAHQPASGSVMVLLTNAGVISRSGPHRINVLLARRFSALGLRSLRWDLSGLGDSARPAQALPMYEQFVADTRAAMDEAQRMYGVSRFIMIGFCSGAEVAYYTALKDERLIGLALFDLFVYPTWKTHWLRITRRVRRHGVFSAARRIALAVLRHVKQRRQETSSDAGDESHSTKPSLADFSAKLFKLEQRGTRVMLMFSGELELHNYENQFRDNFQRFGIVEKVDYAYLSECDHVFTTSRAQQLLTSTVVQWIETRLGAMKPR